MGKIIWLSVILPRYSPQCPSHTRGRRDGLERICWSVGMYEGLREGGKEREDGPDDHDFPFEEIVIDQSDGEAVDRVFG